MSSPAGSDPVRRPFGFDALDRELGGGLPVGRLTALVAPPESQAAMLLDRLTRRHPSLYISLDRPGAEVREHLVAGDHATDPTTAASRDSETLLEEGREGLPDVPAGGVVVVDPANGLETADRREYLGLLNALRSAGADRDCAVVLYCHDAEQPPPLRTATLGRVDLAMVLRQLFHPRRVQTYLTITKHRDGAARPEPLKLILRDHIQVDTSRDIA